MSKVSDLRAIAVWLVCSVLFLSGCGKDKDTDDLALPGGELPMTFATAMEGSTATGTTTAGTWKGGERIAMKVEGSGVKRFTPVVGNLAMLAAVDGGDTFYWQTSGETKRVSAWYVGAGYRGSLPQTWTVKRNQSVEGYGKSDFLYAPPTDISFSNRGSQKLRFKHLLAKVVVHLKNGDGLTEKDIQDATVTLVSQAIKSGEIHAADGSVVQTAPGTEEITPNVWAAPKVGYLKSVQALLVPQQMQGKKFIKVTVGTGDAARDYYYTPTEATDANLENGKQYAYEITVSKTGLTVQSVSGKWTDFSLDGTVVDKATFRVKLTGGPLLNAPTLDGIQATTAGKVYETTGGNSFSFSYTTSNRAEVPAFTIEKGMATETRAEISNNDGTTTYTYTCTNIRSDLWINHLAAGYYYYADGTWSSEYTAGEPACIGIVFWVGDATEKDEKTLKKDHPGCTHGLVVALKDAIERISWQKPESSVQSWLNNNKSGVYLSVVSDFGDAPVNNIQGYNNTKAIEEFNAADANSGNLVQAVAKAAEYRQKVPTPANSSKWYLPSAKELALLCGGDVDNIAGNKVGTTNRDLINGKLKSISSATQIQPAYYWSSTEYSYRRNYAFFVNFDNGYVNSDLKNYTYRVRCVLAF